MVLMAVAWETPSRRAMSVGRASPSPAQQIGDQFDIVLEQRGRLRRPRLAEAARLGAFRRQLCHRDRALRRCVAGRAAICARSRQPCPRPIADIFHRAVSKCSLGYICIAIDATALHAYAVADATFSSECCKRIGSMRR